MTSPAMSNTISSGEKHGRSLLMIAYKFPPMRSVSCNRTWAIYRGMQEYFDSVHVISTSNRHILLQEPVEGEDGFVTDAKTIDYRTLFQRGGKSAVASEKAKVSIVGKIAGKAQSSFPLMQVFGEGNLLYVRNAVAKARDIIKEHNITHVFSTFPPYADHLIAAKLKQTFPQLYWIADFRDLHVDPAQDNLFWRRYQKFRNKEILKDADLVTTVSRGLAEHLREFHPHVVVLPNGIRSLQPRARELFPKFTIAYTGSMFQEKRKPDSLLAALRQLIDDGTIQEGEIDMVYAGKDGAVWSALLERYHLKHIFRDRGMLSQAEAETIQVRSHVNLLLTYSTGTLKGNVTGKLYDYLRARRPVLVLINGPVDAEIESLIAATNAGEVVYDGDVLRITDVLSAAYDTWKRSGNLLQNYDSEALNALKWPAILHTFMSENFTTVSSPTISKESQV